MINKIVIGAGAALGLAVLVLFNMLLSAKEANGALNAELHEAVMANAIQTEQIGMLVDQRDELKERFEAERERADRFAVAETEAQRQLEKQKSDFRRRLADVRKSLTTEQLACADSAVPDAYFEQLRVESGSSNPD